MGELVSGSAADAPADAGHDAGPVGVGRRVPDGERGQQGEADRALPAQGHEHMRATGVGPQRLHDADAVEGVMVV